LVNRDDRVVLDTYRGMGVAVREPGRRRLRESGRRSRYAWRHLAHVAGFGVAQ